MTSLLQRWYSAGGSAAALLSEAATSLLPGSDCENDGAFLHRVEVVLLTAKTRGDLVMVCAWLARLGAKSIVDAYDGDCKQVLERLETMRVDLESELDEAVTVQRRSPRR